MLTYNDISRDPGKLPEASLQALLARGFAHLLGNECASKTVARIRAHLTPEGGKAGDVTTEAIKAFRTANPEQVSKWAGEAQAEALRVLDEGKLGVREPRQPRTSSDPIGAMIARLVRESVITTLKANGIRIPKGEEKITFANGTTRTMAEMVAKRGELGTCPHGKFEFSAEAHKRLAAEAKKLERAKAESQGKGAAEDLGL